MKTIEYLVNLILYLNCYWYFYTSHVQVRQGITYRECCFSFVRNCIINTRLYLHIVKLTDELNNGIRY